MQELLGVAIPIVVLHAVVLVVLLVGIKLLLSGTANRAVKRVRQVEGEVRKKEEDIRREIDEHERDFAEKKAEADRQLQAHRDEARREAAHLKEKAVSEAKKESQKIIEQAHKNEARIREQIARQMEDKAVEYGGRIFKLVFSDLLTGELNELFNAELIDALNEIESGSITVDSGAANVTVSHPMSDEQRNRLQSVLREKFRDDAEIEETVDETLLAGLILKMGSLEIDGSLKNRYSEAVSEVKKEAHHELS
jgi:F0F1-type ATP synthase membrane subunit b/b'